MSDDQNSYQPRIQECREIIQKNAIYINQIYYLTIPLMIGVLATLFLGYYTIAIPLILLSFIVLYLTNKFGRNVENALAEIKKLEAEASIHARMDEIEQRMSPK